jgi:hypothetical protein
VSSDDQRVVDAWRAAAIDLGIEVVSPFVLEGFDGEPVEFLALVRGFGCAAGTLITTTDRDVEFAFALSDARGYYASGLNPEHYSTYDRAEFMDTLNDWGWYGPGAAPAWSARSTWSASE